MSFMYWLKNRMRASKPRPFFLAALAVLAATGLVAPRATHAASMEALKHLICADAELFEKLWDKIDFSAKVPDVLAELKRLDADRFALERVEGSVGQTTQWEGELSMRHRTRRFRVEKRVKAELKIQDQLFGGSFSLQFSEDGAPLGKLAQDGLVMGSLLYAADAKDGIFGSIAVEFYPQGIDDVRLRCWFRK